MERNDKKGKRMLEINLRQLEAFVTTAEYSSFTRAAEELYLTQSTVSAHIRTLEQALGAQLILRGARRKVTLTEEGKAVARRPVSGSLVPFVEIQAAETVRIPVCEEDKIDWELQWDQEALEAPLRAGGSAGRMICRVNGEEAACVPLVFAQDVERTLQPPGGIWTRLMELWNR